MPQSKALLRRRPDVFLLDSFCNDIWDDEQLVNIIADDRCTSRVAFVCLWVFMSLGKKHWNTPSVPTMLLLGGFCGHLFAVCNHTLMCASVPNNSSLTKHVEFTNIVWQQFKSVNVRGTASEHTWKQLCGVLRVAASACCCRTFICETEWKSLCWRHMPKAISNIYIFTFWFNKLG